MTCLAQDEDGRVRLPERVIKMFKIVLDYYEKQMILMRFWDMVEGIMGYNGGNCGMW